MAYGIDLKLCTMLYYHLQMCILSGRDDPIIFLKVIVDLRGVEGLNNLTDASQTRGRIGFNRQLLETYIHISTYSY